jgi:hypothetical protein
VIDTVGIKIGPFSMIDWFGTPYTEALHVVERYRLIDFEAGKEAEARGAREKLHIPLRMSGATGLMAAPDYRARRCNSNLPSRTKAFSRCRGRRPSLIGVRSNNGPNLCVPKLARNVHSQGKRHPAHR